MQRSQSALWQRLVATLGWTRSSTVLMSTFIATLVLIGLVWWPLAKEQLDLIDWSTPLWRQVDWLLLFCFAVMSLLIVAGADLKADVWTVLIGLCGGLVIESWGTQTELWSYYTLERPPLWILPAWPIAALSFNRLARLLDLLVPKVGGSGRPVQHGEVEALAGKETHHADRLKLLLRKMSLTGNLFRLAYWLIFGLFFVLLLSFVWPAIAQPLTVMAVALCVLFILSPADHRLAVLTFAGGTSLGYFLERWGTTRLCWTYYTEFEPPVFSVMAHGMAAVAFWRTKLLLDMVWSRVMKR
ncbi:MAG: hypothetical protein JXA89_10080 [Anaerolineae bacterium]|nr:hypothetical protein [Anaerolineae bacterium]